MVRNDKDFVVYDAKSGDDLTHAVLTQIIVEQESREGGHTLLPIPFFAPAHPLLRRQHRHDGAELPAVQPREFGQGTGEVSLHVRDRFLKSCCCVRGLSGPGARKHGDVRAGYEHVDLVRQ